MNLSDYQNRAEQTDRIDEDENGKKAILELGMLGELGSLLAEKKKALRDGDAYTGSSDNLAEELGDMLWYVARAASIEGIRLDDLDDSSAQVSDTVVVKLTEHLLLLSRSVQDLVDVLNSSDASKSRTMAFGETISAARNVCDVEGLLLSKVLDRNIKKNEATWTDPLGATSRWFDKELAIIEQLPRRFDVEFIEIDRGDSKEVLQRINGITVGDRLTDNSYDVDGYRYHDSFHLAYVAVLGWSPVVRRMLRVKRKSIGKVDEVDDGARAAIIEEAVASLVFNYARQHSMLRKLDRVDQSLLKHIREMVRGLEVQDCSAWEWQSAILEGYRVFRELDGNGGGWVHIDSDEREISYSLTKPS